MDVTDVQVRLTEETRSKLRAYCRVTFDGALVVHDIKVIDAAHGYLVAMPSRRAKSRCPGCGTKNVVGAAYCNDCGGAIPPRPAGDTARLHSDVVHPINQKSRERIERRVIDAFESALRAKARGSAPGRFDAGDAPPPVRPPSPSTLAPPPPPPSGPGAPASGAPAGDAPAGEA